MNAVAVDKKQISLIAGIVLSALIALAAVFGYDVVVVAPREQVANALSEQIVLDQAEQVVLDLLGQAGGSRAVGDTNFTNVVAAGDVTVGGATAADGGLTVGGGFGATGCTVSAAGVLQCDGAATIGGAAVITGATTFQGAMNVNANGDFDSISVAGNSDLTTINNTGANPITINDNLIVTGTTGIDGAVTITGTLTFGGVALSGPVRFGSASTVVSGTLIAHSLATTPTVVLLTAGVPITTPLYITASNATSMTVGINDAVSVVTVYWLAGK